MSSVKPEDGVLCQYPHGSVVSSVRVDPHGKHAIIRVWNRGALAGSLLVRLEDAGEIVRRLSP